MAEQKARLSLLNSVRKKGTDFDRDGDVDSLDQLIKLGGIFQLKDIIDRLPFNQYTVKNWAYQESSRFRPCFHLVPVGSVRSMKLIDLALFNKILQETLTEDEPTATRQKSPVKRASATGSKKPPAKRRKP